MSEQSIPVSGNSQQSARRARRLPKVEKTCEACGKTFLAKGSEAHYRKNCSKTCYLELKRRIPVEATYDPSDSSVRLIPLSQGKVAMVDAEDFERLSQWKWHAEVHDCTSYAIRNIRLENGKTTSRRMHNEVTGLDFVDHKDSNGLNNRKSNLRAATAVTNSANQKLSRLNKWGLKGVNLHRDGKWRATIRQKHLGLFCTPEEAARAYDRAAIEAFGEFAKVNFPCEAS